MPTLTVHLWCAGCGLYGDHWIMKCPFLNHKDRATVCKNHNINHNIDRYRSQDRKSQPNSSHSYVTYEPLENANLNKILQIYSDESYYTTFINNTDITPKSNPFECNPFGNTSNNKHEQIENNTDDHNHRDSQYTESSIWTASPYDHHSDLEKGDNDGIYDGQIVKQQGKDTMRTEDEKVNKQGLFTINKNAPKSKARKSKLRSFHDLPEIKYISLPNL